MKSFYTEGVISDAVLLSRHPGISSDTQALLGSRLLRALSHSRFLSLCRDWELQVDGGAASLVKHRLIKKKKALFQKACFIPNICQKVAVVSYLRKFEERLSDAHDST